jgi:hypothetical protein
MIEDAQVPLPLEGPPKTPEPMPRITTEVIQCMADLMLRLATGESPEHVQGEDDDEPLA